MKPDLKRMLNDFSSISLKEMDSVALMKRTDTKFILHQNQLAAVLAKLKNRYRVLEINGNRVMSYESVYFDTDELKFYHDHHNGKAGRIKIRMRKYVESDLCFLEIKQKDRKGNTLKSRVKVADFEAELSETSKQFINKTIAKAYALKPAITNEFNRFTLVNTTSTERVTVDMNIAFRLPDAEKAYQNLVIIEVKQERINRNTAIMQELRWLGILPYSISKYCIGMASMNKGLKYNIFKPKLLKINKLTA